MQVSKELRYRFVKNAFIFILCGSIYSILEIIYKGADVGTHWSMFVLAGISGVVAIAGFNNVFSYEMDFLLQIFMCATFITIGEFLVGITFNKNYTIWDYRNLPFNFKGQICPQFYCMWLFLSSLAIPFLDWIEYNIFNWMPETPPYYKIFGKKIFQFKDKKRR